MAATGVRRLAIPAVSALIAFLAYSSQYLFYKLDPGPLLRYDFWIFNLLLLATWWSYERACRVDAGRLPRAPKKDDGGHSNSEENPHGSRVLLNGRWCKKCGAVKPPRAHHCRQCQRCIPKMDHHCPWTSNCVSHTTFPHFLRFVSYASISLAILDYHLCRRAYWIYEQRDLPAYLGPSIFTLAHLMVLLLMTNVMLFALSVLLVTSIHSLAINTTMIEHWEIERHESLVEKAHRQGGYVYGPRGVKVVIRKQEFPYDIGIWRNMVQAMGSRNVLAWILPFGGGPANQMAWAFETNGFEDKNVSWPPIDPDRLPRTSDHDERRGNAGELGIRAQDIDSFRQRQKVDHERWQKPEPEEMRTNEMRRATDLNERNMDEGEDEYVSEYEEGMDGQEGWTSSDGSRLRDFGVDEDADADADEVEEDDIPLGQLLRQRRALRGEND